MYPANARARSPVLTALPATDTVGTDTPSSERPASFAAARMPDGVMSSEPTICSAARLSRTVERPSTPMAMATTPKTMRTAPAIKPPISKTLRIVHSLRRGRWLHVSDLAHTLAHDVPDAIGGAPRSGAGKPAVSLRAIHMTLARSRNLQRNVRRLPGGNLDFQRRAGTLSRLDLDRASEESDALAHPLESEPLLASQGRIEA